MAEAVKIAAKAFDKGEVRTLMVRDCSESSIENQKSKIENVEIAATLKAAKKHPTHEARFYEIAISGSAMGGSAARVQLNHGDPADDEQRLAEIAEDLLTEEAPGTAGGWSGTGEISPRDAGGL